MAIPSLAMIPSGYKATKLYSVLPTDGVGDFTVARASTATRVNQARLIETMGADVPRLDYSDGGCPVLLTEPQSTNVWANSEGTNTLLSPLGSFDFYDVINDTINNILNLENKTLSMSFLIKKSDNSEPIFGSGGNANADVVVRLAGASGVSDLFTKEDLGNGYWLAKLEDYTVLTTNTDNRISNNSGVPTFVSMIQLEELTYLTSYIKTVGTAVTRVGDVVGGAADATTFNNSEGVLFFEGSALVNGGSDRFIAINDDSTSNVMYILFHNSGRIDFDVFVGGLPQCNIRSTIYNQTDNFKIAARYKENDFSLWINGAEVGIRDTSGITFPASTLKNLDFSLNATTAPFYGKTKQLQVFNTALEDAELIILTTL